MKPYGLLYSVVMVLIIPCILLTVLAIDRGKENRKVSFTEESGYQFIRILDKDQVRMIELEDYIVGVILGELPANFEDHTMKAQAVAARTYTLRRVSSQSKHENADVCTSPSCCQSYLDPDTYQNLEFVKRVEKAVEETSGQVLYYDGKLIESTYFACSGGKTEDALAVWGRDIPYLQSVESPGEEKAKYYEYVYKYSREEFLSRIGLPENLLLYDDSVELIYTNGGGVDRMIVGGEEFAGTQLRILLNLPSTAFSLEFTQDTVMITTHGNGHRVGMSQYGADAMAVSGKTYTEILMHYYPGTELVELSTDQLKSIFDKV